MPDQIYADNERRIYDLTTLSMKFKVPGPATVDAFDRRGGKVGSCLESAIDNEVYRGTLPDIQDILAEEVMKTTGQKREVNQAATDAAKSRSKTPDKVANVEETIKRFWNRVKTTLQKEQIAQITSSVQARIDAGEVQIDPAPSTRAKRVNKGYIEKAQQWLALPEDQMEAKVNTALEAVPGYNLERDEANAPTEESLAVLIGAYVDTLV